mmetsp:Transcript_41502/g.93778  ORF Transcript_41502/g.93778 Transcript_41502/m.93778 type:complete len:272 (-) Transcript_41502:293-1108(-)
MREEPQVAYDRIVRSGYRHVVQILAEHASSVVWAHHLPTANILCHAGPVLIAHLIVSSAATRLSEGSRFVESLRHVILNAPLTKPEDGRAVKGAEEDLLIEEGVISRDEDTIDWILCAKAGCGHCKQRSFHRKMLGRDPVECCHGRLMCTPGGLELAVQQPAKWWIPRVHEEEHAAAGPFIGFNQLQSNHPVREMDERLARKALLPLQRRRRLDLLRPQREIATPIARVFEWALHAGAVLQRADHAMQHDGDRARPGKLGATVETAHTPGC